MRFHVNGRRGLSALLAAVALWAIAAPGGLGALASPAMPLAQVDQQDLPEEEAPIAADTTDEHTSAWPCDAITPLMPPQIFNVPGVELPTLSSDQATPDASFRLCGGPSPEVERALEQLIGGRGFSLNLTSRSDGCADLTVRVAPQAGGTTSGRQMARVSVGVGTGGGQTRTIAVQIISENGTTHATVGTGT